MTAIAALEPVVVNVSPNWIGPSRRRILISL
jgi:hypothetical protein